MNQSRTIRLPAHVVKELNVVLRALRHLETHAPAGGREAIARGRRAPARQAGGRRRAAAAPPGAHAVARRADRPRVRAHGRPTASPTTRRARRSCCCTTARSRRRCGMARRAQRAPAHGDRAPLRAERLRRGDARGASPARSASRASACGRSRPRRSTSCARSSSGAATTARRCSRRSDAQIRARSDARGFAAATPGYAATVRQRGAAPRRGQHGDRALERGQRRARSRSLSARVATGAVAQRAYDSPIARERDGESAASARRRARRRRAAPRAAGAAGRRGRAARSELVPQHERALRSRRRRRHASQPTSRPTHANTSRLTTRAVLPRREPVELASRATTSAAGRG